MVVCPGWQLAGVPASIKPGPRAPANRMASPAYSEKKKTTMAVVRRAREGRGESLRRRGEEKRDGEKHRTIRRREKMDVFWPAFHREALEL